MRTTRIRIIHKSRRSVEETPVRLHCRRCGRDVELVTRSQAAVFLEMDAAGLDVLIACGRVHAVVTAAGNVRVCQNSLIVRES